MENDIKSKLLEGFAPNTIPNGIYVWATCVPNLSPILKKLRTQSCYQENYHIHTHIHTYTHTHIQTFRHFF